MGSIVFSSYYSTGQTGYKTFDVRIGYLESYNSATNRTSVQITGVELRIEGNSANWGSLPVFGSVKVAGTTLLSMNGGSAVRVPLSGSGYCAVAIPASGSVEIEHNADGSKSVVFELVGGYTAGGDRYFCALYQQGGSFPFGVRAQSQTVALTTRQRGSPISSYSASVATQESFSLSVARSSNAFFHKARFTLGGALMHESEPFAASLSYTIPRSWFASYPSASTLGASVSVQTYTDESCSAAIGSPATASFTVTADADMRPSLSAGWAALAPYNTGAAASMSGYIRGYSQAEASFDPTKIDLSAAVGASIASYSISCQGTSAAASPYRTGVLTGGAASVVCTVTDTRGRSASESFTLTLAEYAAPSLSGIEVFRCAAAGTADEDGTCYSVRAALSYSSLSGQNSCSLTAAAMPAGGSYGSESALTSGAASVLGPISADASYTVRITATDALGNTAVYYAAIPTRKWAMKFRPNGSGVAFGKAAETDGRLEVSADWDVKLGQPLPISSGGTGADNADDARANLGAEKLKTESVSGSVVYIDAMSARLKELSVGISFSQSGSGRPSLSNIRPITGRTGLTLYVSPTQDAQDATLCPVSWQSQAGTVYGGTLNVKTGVLTVNMVGYNMGNMTWYYSAAAGHERFYTPVSLSGIKGAPNSASVANAACSCFKISTGNATFAHSEDNILAASSSTPGQCYVYIYCSSYTDKASFTSAVSGQTLVLELETPQTVQLTPPQFSLLAGAHYLWADSGASALTYSTEDWYGVFDAVYPVGSIYLSVNSANPSAMFGGTWVQLEGRFLLGAGGGYSAGDTGGEAAHILTVGELPPHGHSYTSGANAINADGSVPQRGYGSGTTSTLAVSDAGGGQAHNNMPPYLVVYMWKRTA